MIFLSTRNYYDTISNSQYVCVRTKESMISIYVAKVLNFDRVEWYWRNFLFRPLLGTGVGGTGGHGDLVRGRGGLVHNRGASCATPAASREVASVARPRRPSARSGCLARGHGCHMAAAAGGASRKAMGASHAAAAAGLRLILLF